MRAFFVVLFIVLLSACGEDPKDREISYPEHATVLSVDGMHCGACKATIMSRLSDVDEVEWAQVEYEHGEVAYYGSANVAEVVNAIQAAGYEVLD